ncbi:toprim domain-containing protein [Campylobacter lanienae]|uniref:toprim domain-containing protein n=1 Tax=Campylobacter lanienae TaxID=75658 RepID=UPI0024310692|nr:toprim domain-containing protein [Campylobacter lanienae]MDD5785946.1 hypothetical protein [Campylobacter lanienae]
MKLSPHQTALFLQNRGYEVDKFYKFKIRPNEKISSASIYKDGKIHDFGTGWHGDIIDFMVAFENLSKQEAFAIAKDFTNQPINNIFKPNNTQTHTQTHTAKCFERDEALEKFQAYKIGRDLNQARFKELVNQTIHTANNNGLNQQLKELLGYDSKRDRITMPIIDSDGNVANFWAYNPNYKEYKVLFEKNRPREIFNIQILNKTRKDELIYICEGEKDTLNAINLGINAIGMPSANSKIKDKDLNLFKDRRICIVFDVDESGRNGAIALKNQLQSVTSQVQILNLEILAKEIKNEPIKRGYDFSDYVKDRQDILYKNMKVDLNR